MLCYLCYEIEASTYTVRFNKLVQDSISGKKKFSQVFVPSLNLNLSDIFKVVKLNFSYINYSISWHTMVPGSGKSESLGQSQGRHQSSDHNLKHATALFFYRDTDIFMDVTFNLYIFCEQCPRYKRSQRFKSGLPLGKSSSALEAMKRQKIFDWSGRVFQRYIAILQCLVTTTCSPTRLNNRLEEELTL